MAPTLTSNGKVGSESSSSAKSKDIAYGGGGFDFGLDYRKVKVDANYVPGPIFTEEEAEQEDLDQAYRTVPLELTGPLGTASPKLGGSSVDFGVVYTKPAGLPAEPVMQRQSSKPWEDQEMLYKVHDTLSHISYPYKPPAAPAPAVPGAPSNISCLNMYSNAPPPSVAPPPYVPGPPTEPETNYVDPFPSYQPPPVADDEDDYEFVPVRERRNQFSKSDFATQERKPIKPQRPPPVFAPPPPAPAPVPKPKPQTPTPAPMYTPPAPFMPAEGEVVQPEVPAWAGTLSSSGGPKRWDDGYKQTPRNKPARSVSPTKKAAAPTDFKPTQTKVIDFSGEVDEGPRIMHLQYNSPLDMYSKENVEETLQGQTNAALGGGNTVAQPKKTPAEERDWSQSALLRLIQEEESLNVPKTAPFQPVQGAPRPAASPPKNVVAPPQPSPPSVVPEALAEPQEVVPNIPNSIQFQNAMPMTGVSDF